MAEPALIPLSTKLSDLALKRYMEAFLDPERMSFGTYLMLEKLRRNKGYRNSGFMLWDYLKDNPKKRPYLISEKTLLSYSHKLSDLLVYWDCAYVDSLSFFPQTNRICAARFEDLTDHLDRWPPTLYMFDREFSWTLIRTDEPQNELGWNCIQIGEIGGAGRKPAPAPAADSASPKLIPLQRHWNE